MRYRVIDGFREGTSGQVTDDAQSPATGRIALRPRRPYEVPGQRAQNRRRTVVARDIRATRVALASAEAKLAIIAVIGHTLAADRGDLALLRRRLDESGKT